MKRKKSPSTLRNRAHKWFKAHEISRDFGIADTPIEAWLAGYASGKRKPKKLHRFEMGTSFGYIQDPVLGEREIVNVDQETGILTLGQLKKGIRK